MAILSITLKENKNDRSTRYKNKVNAEDFKKLSLVLSDLKNLGLPIEKAVKDFKLDISDWDAALGL